MRLTTILCQLADTFAGFLPTARCLTAVALVSYLVNRSHSWYAAFLQTFVLVQGTFTPQVIRHDRRTKPGAIRLGNIGNIYASPVAGGGRVYVTDLDGKTIVVSHDDQPKVLTINTLDDEFAASAAIVGRELFLRGKRHLYCLATGGGL